MKERQFWLFIRLPNRIPESPIRKRQPYRKWQYTCELRHLKLEGDDQLTGQTVAPISGTERSRGSSVFSVHVSLFDRLLLLWHLTRPFTGLIRLGHKGRALVSDLTLETERTRFHCCILKLVLKRADAQRAFRWITEKMCTLESLVLKEKLVGK